MNKQTLVLVRAPTATFLPRHLQDVCVDSEIKGQWIRVGLVQSLRLSLLILPKSLSAWNFSTMLDVDEFCHKSG